MLFVWHESVCVYFSPKHQCWAQDGALRAEHMSWTFLCLWRLGMKSLQRSTPGKHAWLWSLSLRTAPLCILLISERKHVCWGVGSTLDLAVTQPSEEGNGDPGPFSEEMPAQPLGTLLLFYHGHFTCKLFLQNMHCWLPVLYWECFFQGVLIGTLLTTVLAP